MKEYKGFKVGDKVEITKKPSCWTSGGGRSPMDQVYPIKGVISKLFNDDCCPTATINGFGFAIETLIKDGSIKKLPKYAVGDVVRLISPSGKKEEILTVRAIEGEVYAFEEKLGRFSECFVSPFDGFRIGDTVWTVKRGKGVIRGMTTWSRKDTRSYAVFFDKDGWYYPRNTNLIPTEAKYKYLVEASKKPLVPSAEAWAKVADAFGKSLTAIEVAANLKKFSDACKKFPSGGVVYQCPKVDPLIPRRLLWYTDFVEPRKKPTYTRTAPGHLEIVDEEGCQKGYRASKFAVGELVSYAGCIRAVVDAIHWKDGKFTYDIRTNYCLIGLPEDSLIAVHQPKFKAGDVVYFKNIGHSLCATENPNKYIVENPSAACGYVTLKRWDNKAAATCKESDLRLWKETVLTQGMQSSGTWVTPCGGRYTIDPTWELTYLGEIVGYDTFLCKSKTNPTAKPALFRGTKGDDIS